MMAYPTVVYLLAGTRATTRLLVVLALAGALASPLVAQAHHETRGGSDSAYAAMQARGELAMGVDQYSSTHKFEALPDGGRIELQRDVDDSAGVERIRRHLREVARAFAAGDFRSPRFVHAREVPGSRVMAAKRDLISYTVRDLPRGGELRITAGDSVAVRAIHEFLAFQRHDHRAGER